MPPAGRLAGIDLARGLAVVLMIQAHATDAWVRPDAKGTAAYAVTRILAAVPAPLFLLLAGVGLALAERAGAGRRRLARRGLEVVAWGYAVSAAYAAIDGSWQVATLLRADILHAIGLSLAVCALVLVGAPRPGLRAGVLAIAATAAQPLLAWAAGGPLAVPSWLAPAAGLVVDVPAYTRFPVLPLVAFTALGHAAGRWLAGARPPARAGLALAAAGSAVAAAAQAATGAALAALGGALSRRHPAVALNVVDGAARALAVVGLGWATAAALGRPGGGVLGPLARLGRGSLLAYAVHIPFCYSRLARPVAGKLDLPQALAGVAVLTAVMWCVVRARDALRSHRDGAPRPRPAGGPG